MKDSLDRIGKGTSTRALLWATSLYILVTLAFHAAVLGDLNRAIIGIVSDNLLFMWDGWWLRESLFQGRNPLYTDILFAPVGSSLALHSLKPIPSSLLTGLDSFLSLELSYNLVVLFAFPFAGVSTYLLSRRFTGEHVGAWCGGLVFMISPFIVSKTTGGWIHLAWVGCLPLFFLALLNATEPEAKPRSAIVLALATLLVVFVSEMMIVFAANVAVFTVLWRFWTARDRKQAVRRIFAAVWPSVLAAGPYLGLLFFLAMCHDLQTDVERRLDYIPDVWSYVLPFNMSSLYAVPLNGESVRKVLSTTFVPPLGRNDLACYLGLLVCPLALLGLYLHRHQQQVKLVALLFGGFLILSLGPRLLVNREVVELAGVAIRMPFAIWQRIPVLGEISQSGRYLAISYMALAIGFAFLVSYLRNRLDVRRANLLTAGLALAVSADYAFRAWTAPLPPTPTLSAGGGTVLDPRLKSGHTMYYQTQHGQPLAGGYLSRPPNKPISHYRQVPGMDCLFFGRRDKDCRKESLLDGLQKLNVSDVMLDPDDWRNDLLREHGFGRVYGDEYTVVWSVPR